MACYDCKIDCIRQQPYKLTDPCSSIVKYVNFKHLAVSDINYRFREIALS